MNDSYGDFKYMSIDHIENTSKLNAWNIFSCIGVIKIIVQPNENRISNIEYNEII